MNLREYLFSEFKIEVECATGFRFQESRRDYAVYCWNISSRLVAFISLDYTSVPPSFRLFGYWSKRRRFPSKLGPDMIPDEDEPINGEFAFDLSELWLSEGGKAWSLSAHNPDQHVDEIFSAEDFDEEAAFNAMVKVDEGIIPYEQGNVQRQVGDAISMLEKYGIPYFERVALQCRFHRSPVSKKKK